MRATILLSDKMDGNHRNLGPKISVVSPKKKKRSRGIYILPSLLTALALFSGFFAIIYTFKALSDGTFDFSIPGIAIVIAIFLDGLDGRVARLMKAESEFGVQFDSIADMVSFGVAPAVLSYAYALAPLNKWGWMGAFLFLAAAGIRLARFNITTSSPVSRKYFKGLPSPIAAAGIALVPLMGLRWEGSTFNISMLVFTIFLSILMVSNVRFRSFKDFDFRKKAPLPVFLAVILLITLGFSFRENVLCGLFVIYLIWGLSEELSLFLRRRKSDPSTPFLPFGDRDEEEKTQP